MHHCLAWTDPYEGNGFFSAVMPAMSIYKLPHGRYGYSGHVVNLPQDVASFFCLCIPAADQIPPRLASNQDVIVVRREEANQTHSDFHVRQEIFQRALQWLITNNKYWVLPSTPLLLHSSQGMEQFLKTALNQALCPLQVTLQLPVQVQDDHLSFTFVPIAVSSMTEQEGV